MCGTLAKWGSIVERLGEGRLRERDARFRHRRIGAGKALEAPFPLQHLQSIKMMESILHVVPIIGAGGADCWCRCIGVLAQVRKNGADLRQHNAQNRDSRRRFHPKNPTCAKNMGHLRQKRC